jgi:antitoxin (DNA-binding transcriptional repressor) of toxin-antitoxin stability system
LSDYPKLLWSPEGVEVCVVSREDEAARVADGYTVTQPGTPVADVAPVDADPVVEADPYDTEPTFGASGDDTHPKRRRKA